MTGFLSFASSYTIIGFSVFILHHRFTEVLPELPQSGWRQEARTIGSALYCVYLVRVLTLPSSFSHCFRILSYLLNTVKLALMA